MKLINIEKLNYNIIEKNNIIGNIGIVDDELKFKLSNNILIKIFPKFLNLIKDNTNIRYIYYKGDNLYLKNNYLNKDNDVIIYLYPYTYMIKSSTLDEKIYTKLFKKRGNWINYQGDEKFADLIVIQGNKYTSEESLFKYKSIINNRVIKNTTEGLRKNNFHLLLKQSIKNKLTLERYNFVLTKSFKPNTFKTFFNNKIGIIKPNDGYSGKEIRIIKDYKDFILNIKELKQEREKEGWSEERNEENNFINKKNWILEKYLIDPLLYKKRKFHSRVYIIYSSNNKVFIYNKFRIARAQEDYKKDDFKNKNIHDTHFLFVPEYIYLDEFINKKNLKIITDKMIILFSEIFKNVKPECAKDTEYCYKIFGADVLIEKDYNIKLLEINFMPGFPLTEKNVFEELFINSMYYIIDDILPPKNKVKDPKMFLKLNT